MLCANPLLLLQKILLLKYWTWLMSVAFLPIIAKWDIQESFQTIIIASNSLWPMILRSFLINYIKKNNYYLEIKRYLKQIHISIIYSSELESLEAISTSTFDRILVGHLRKLDFGEQVLYFMITPVFVT